MEEKEQYVDNLYMIMSIGLDKFQNDLLEMAKENWCPSQVDMLNRLIEAVIQGKRYDEVEVD